MKKQGVVIATDGELATVEIYNNPSCINCTKRTGSIACVSCSNYDDSPNARIVAFNESSAENGDRVMLAVSKRQKVLLYMVSFVMPIIFAAIAYFCLSVFTEDARIKYSGALCAAMIAMLLAALCSYKISKNSYDYIITSIVKD